MPPTAEWNPEVIAFCCNYCAHSAAALAGSQRLQYPAGVRILSMPCTGKLEMEHILEAFEKGVDGILIVGCLEGDCHFVDGNLRARKRTERICAILDEIGLGSGRLKMVNLSDVMASAFVEHIQEAMDTIRALGPNPLRAQEPKESVGTL
ncbi:MAG: hydrogenase iron-sulfur subunit [Acidobacteriota bacterium]|jgi:coenzyme F420-reducing hydrogenase delta subunit|nr:hydrogenase iron-sulfur subunit [Acidobacteriota bacterium]